MAGHDRRRQRGARRHGPLRGARRDGRAVPRPRAGLRRRRGDEPLRRPWSSQPDQPGSLAVARDEGSPDRPGERLQLGVDGGPLRRRAVDDGRASAPASRPARGAASTGGCVASRLACSLAATRSRPLAVDGHDTVGPLAHQGPDVAAGHGLAQAGQLVVDDRPEEGLLQRRGGRHRSRRPGRRRRRRRTRSAAGRGARGGRAASARRGARGPAGRAPGRRRSRKPGPRPACTGSGRVGAWPPSGGASGARQPITMEVDGSPLTA